MGVFNVWLLVLCLFNAGESPEYLESPHLRTALETIDSEDIFAYIDLLASDALNGRNAGTAGNERAVELIAERFRRLGLKPAGDRGTYLQAFYFRPRGTSGNRESSFNVIAVLEGSDPRLREEAIVVGAHLDHVGRKGQSSNPGRLGETDDNDIIWNGADDNASGTSAVLEIAQAFVLCKQRPLRSIVFVLFNAEEHGLYGSRHYVKHPPMPLEQTVAMINLDMVGRNADDAVQVISTESASGGALKSLARACASGVPDLSLEFDLTAFRGSDHAHFLSSRIPVAFFFSGLHRDYHHVTDEVDKIDCNRVARVARVAFLMAHRLASQEERITYNPDFDSKTDVHSKRRVLGVEIGERVHYTDLEGLSLDSDQGAVRVKAVFEGSPAAEAGIEKGDLILALGTVRIRLKEPMTSLGEAIRAAPEGVEVPLEILRKNKIYVRSVRFSKDD